MKLFYRKIGEKGANLIILHGLFGMSDNWLSLAKLFAETFQVYLLDLRNHGQSPQADDWSYEVMANDVAEFINDHKLSDTFCIGHSMGGKVLLNFADRYPELYKKLIVVDIAPRFYPVHHHMILQGLHSINLETLQSRTEANEILKRFEENEGVRQFLLKNLWRNPNLNRFDWRFNLDVLTKEISQIGEEQYPKQVSSKPILFINGATSSYITHDDVIEIKRYFTNVQFAEIQGAGHWVQADKPAEFVEIVSNYLN